MLAKQELRYGAAYEIATYLNQENTFGRPLYLLTDHIAYWFTDSYPPTNIVTHPSNIAKMEILKALAGKDVSTEGEIKKVFQKQSEFVVTRDDVWYLNSNTAKIVLEETLSSEYVLVREIQGRKIYKRSHSNVNNY